MKEKREQFVRETHLLSKSNPAAWANFVEAFKGWVAEEVESTFSVPTEATLEAKGFGRCLLALRDDFVNIDKIAAKYVKQTNG